MTGFNMAASMYGMFPNYYNNQVALNDLSGMDMYPTLGMMTDPMLSMNGSIFGGYAGMGMPYMPVMGGGMYNYDQYYNNYQKYQDFMIDNRLEYNQKMRQADLKLNAPQEGVAKQAMYLHEKIMQNEQTQIQQAYKNYLASVKAMYGGGTDAEVANRASTLYKDIHGCSLTDDIRKYGRDSFTQGFLQTATFGFADDKTAEENIAELTGQPVGRSDNAKKLAGNIAGGAVVGGGAIASAGLIWKGLRTGAKTKTFWGILLGAGIATAAALGLCKS